MKNFRKLAIFLAVLIFCTGCNQSKQAAADNKTTLEKSAPESTTTAGRLDYREVKLDNGLNVITLEDFSCPIVSVQIWYNVGSKNENPERQGFAHMFEHMMFRGTDRLGPSDHFSLIRRVGGETNGHTGFDKTVYLETLPADQLELALWLEAERMSFLKIDQTAFDTERKVVEEERRMRINEPYGTLFENLMPEIYKVHPYRWLPIGKISHLRASSVGELRDFWQKYYVPNNATLIIVGAVKHGEAQKLAEKYFGWIPRYNDPPKVTVAEPMPESSRSIIIKEDNAPAPGAGIVFRAVPLKDKDSVVFDVMAEILGGGNSSRLYRLLVAEKQMAVMAQAESWSMEQDGLFGAGALLTPFGGDPNTVLDVVDAQIARFRSEPVTERELTKAKNQLLRRVTTERLTDESKAETLGNAAVNYGDVSYVNRQIDEIKKVTAEDIIRVANQYLTPQRALKVTVPRNLMGTVLRTQKEEDSPVTAAPETIAPPPGRPGVVRPKDYPEKAPVADSAASKLSAGHVSRRLANGLKVLVVPNHEAPFVTAQLGLLYGGWTESKAGTASMTMKMLTKGTAQHTESQLADELETYAISLSGQADMDTATINLACLSENIERGMPLLGEIVLWPTFPADEFEKLRKQVRTSLAVSSGEPEYIAEKEFRRQLYGQHPYSRTATGEVNDVDALTIEDMKIWWGTFARPDMMSLIIAGDIDADKAFEIAEKTFGSFNVTAAKPEIKMPSVPKIDRTQIFLVDKPDSTQCQIRIGQHGITRNDKDYFTSRVVSNYFGWSFNSRLNESLRIAKGLTYGVWGSYISQRFAGEFKVGTFSKTESAAQAVQAALDEINRLKTQGPSEEELASSKSFILGTFVKDREIPQQIAADLWLIESQQLSNDFLDRLLAGVAATKPEDCKRLVDNTLTPDKLTIVVVGPAEKIKTQLEEIAPVIVITAPNETKE